MRPVCARVDSLCLKSLWAANECVHVAQDMSSCIIEFVHHLDTRVHLNMSVSALHVVNGTECVMQRVSYRDRL